MKCLCEVMHIVDKDTGNSEVIITTTPHDMMAADFTDLYTYCKTEFPITETFIINKFDHTLPKNFKWTEYGNVSATFDYTAEERDKTDKPTNFRLVMKCRDECRLKWLMIHMIDYVNKRKKRDSPGWTLTSDDILVNMLPKLRSTMWEGVCIRIQQGLDTDDLLPDSTGHRPYIRTRTGSKIFGKNPVHGDTWNKFDDGSIRLVDESRDNPMALSKVKRLVQKLHIHLKSAYRQNRSLVSKIFYAVVSKKILTVTLSFSLRQDLHRKLVSQFSKMCNLAISNLSRVLTENQPNSIDPLPICHKASEECKEKLLKIILQLKKLQNTNGAHKSPTGAQPNIIEKLHNYCKGMAVRTHYSEEIGTDEEDAACEAVVNTVCGQSQTSTAAKNFEQNMKAAKNLQDTITHNHCPKHSHLCSKCHFPKVVSCAKHGPSSGKLATAVVNGDSETVCKSSSAAVYGGLEAVGTSSSAAVNGGLEAVDRSSSAAVNEGLESVGTSSSAAVNGGLEAVGKTKSAKTEKNESVPPINTEESATSTNSQDSDPYEYRVKHVSLSLIDGSKSVTGSSYSGIQNDKIQVRVRMKRFPKNNSVVAVPALPAVPAVPADLDTDEKPSTWKASSWHEAVQNPVGMASTADKMLASISEKKTNQKKNGDSKEEKKKSADAELVLKKIAEAKQMEGHISRRNDPRFERDEDVEREMEHWMDTTMYELGLTNPLDLIKIAQTTAGNEMLGDDEDFLDHPAVQKWVARRLGLMNTDSTNSSPEIEKGAEGKKKKKNRRGRRGRSGITPASIAQLKSSSPQGVKTANGDNVTCLKKEDPEKKGNVNEGKDDAVVEARKVKQEGAESKQEGTENKEEVTKLKEELSKLQLEVNKLKQEAGKKLKTCAKCGREEPKPKTFKKCQKCRTDVVENARYYCGRDCQVSDWGDRHKEEHRNNSFP